MPRSTPSSAAPARRPAPLLRLLSCRSTAGCGRRHRERWHHRCPAALAAAGTGSTTLTAGVVLATWGTGRRAGGHRCCGEASAGDRPRRGVWLAHLGPLEQGRGSHGCPGCFERLVVGGVGDPVHGRWTAVPYWPEDEPERRFGPAASRFRGPRPARGKAVRGQALKQRAGQRARSASSRTGSRSCATSSLICSSVILPGGKLRMPSQPAAPPRCRS